MSSKVPSPRARYSRLGNPCGWQTYTSSSPSPSTSATAMPWWPFESRASAESSVFPQSSSVTLSCRRNESMAPKAAVVTSVKMGTEALLRVSRSAVHSTTCQPEGLFCQRICHRPTRWTR